MENYVQENHSFMSRSWSKMGQNELWFSLLSPHFTVHQINILNWIECDLRQIITHHWRVLRNGFTITEPRQSPRMRETFCSARFAALTQSLIVMHVMYTKCTCLFLSNIKILISRRTMITIDRSITCAFIEPLKESALNKTSRPYSSLRRKPTCMDIKSSWSIREKKRSDYRQLADHIIEES